MLVERGNIPYSAVTHPISPSSFLNGGNFSSTDAVQITFVFPISIKHDPSALGINPRVIFVGRNWALPRPSNRGIGVPSSLQFFSAYLTPYLMILVAFRRH